MPSATSTPRKPRASSQARIAAILAAARALLAEGGPAGLSIYTVAERAEMPPSSVYHFFPSVPALLQALTAEVHAAFRACLQQPVDHAELHIVGAEDRHVLANLVWIDHEKPSS